MSADDARPDPDRARLLDEQAAYYRAIAPEYHEHTLPVPGGAELAAAVDAWEPRGRLLELACGQGQWTERLARRGVEVTAVDASAEMLAIAARRPGVGDVRFVQADLFRWSPDRSYDAVFFGFWLSHVPPERFVSFWASIRSWLAPGGEVFFVDDAHRTEEETGGDPSSIVVLRRLVDGTAFRILKIPYTPHELQERLAGLGWQCTVRATAGPFYWGRATPRT